MNLSASARADRGGAVIDRVEAGRPAAASELRVTGVSKRVPRPFRGGTLLALILGAQVAWFVILAYLFLRLGR